jgi:ribosome-binding ATPase YchF (GTP1/OBG family)
MLSVALAGKPNAGKSTFYKAATRADVDVGNYPFTTIDANRGVSHVRTRCPCLDLEERCGNDNCRDGKRGWSPAPTRGGAWATSSSTN